MEPFEQEARSILTSLMMTVDQQAARAKRVAAAESLVAEFVALAKSVGLSAGPLQDDPSNLYVALEQGRSIHILFDGDGGVHMRRSAFGQRGGAEQAPLRYDALTNTYVGMEQDATVVPVPGSKIPMVHGVVVLSQLAAKLFA